MLEGEITEASVARVNQATCVRPQVHLSSPGGDAETAFRLLNTLRRKQASLVIERHCLSACAELILPLYSKLVVRPGTMIAVHGNPMMKQFLTSHYKPPGWERCGYRDAERMRVEYRQNGRRVDFWRWQLEQLRLTDFVVQSDSRPGTCPSMRMKFSHDALAVTRSELKERLGIDVGVETCADVPGCVSAQERGAFRGSRFATSAARR